MASGVLLESAPVWGAVGVRSRRWIPSLLDWFFLAVLVWLFATGQGGWSGLLADADAGWHIRTGELILERGRVPATDPFSFSKPDAPWFAWEWASDVGMALLHRAGGLKALVMVAAVLIALTAALLLRFLIWRGANPLAALLVTLVACGASTMHYLARPHLISLLLLVAALWLIERDRRQPDRAVWCLVPMTALWTNLHGGFMALIACLVMLVVGTAVETLLAKSSAAPDWGPAKRYTLLTVLCGLATLLNPYGGKLHAHIGQYLQSSWIRNLVQEFQAPGFRRENELYFEGLLLLGVALVAVLVARRRVVEPLWILFWAHQALGATRHIPLFAIVVAPVAASEISSWWRTLVRPQPRRSLAGILGALSEDMAPAFRYSSLWVPALVLAAIFVNPLTQWPWDFPSQMFPVKLIEGHEQMVAGARVLTSDQWGDYLIYRFYPQQRVFIDGRSDFYGPAIGDQYLHMAYGHADWERLMAGYGFQVVLSPVDWPLTSLLKTRPDWRVVAQDKLGTLFVHAGSPAAGTNPGSGDGTKGLVSSGWGLMKTTDSAEKQKGDRSGI
jgi:hypothetical protein